MPTPEPDVPAANSEPTPSAPSPAELTPTTNQERALDVAAGGWPVRGQVGPPYAGLACGGFHSSFIFFSPNDLLSRSASAKLKPARLMPVAFHDRLSQRGHSLEAKEKIHRVD